MTRFNKNGCWRSGTWSFHDYFTNRLLKREDSKASLNYVKGIDSVLIACQWPISASFQSIIKQKSSFSHHWSWFIEIIFGLATNDFCTIVQSQRNVSGLSAKFKDVFNAQFFIGLIFFNLTFVHRQLLYFRFHMLLNNAKSYSSFGIFACLV